MTDAADRPVVPLDIPAQGIPPVTDTPGALEKVIESFAQGGGPIAADAERASGYRYGQRTYLIQLRRAGAGTALIDPVALPDLGVLNDAIGDAEWILHAASQDLPGFADHGLRPSQVFDTELASRLLGMPRVGLAAVVADTLGLGLAKEHSGADWSTRPLPRKWLNYAALDVEVLIEVRAVLASRLAEAGKLSWALEEFEAVRNARKPAVRPDPWRRVSGVHFLRDRRQLAIARALWSARDLNARRRDIAPGRVLPDRAIIAAAKAAPHSVAQLVTLPEFSGKMTRRRAPMWQSAIDSALRLPQSALPPLNAPQTNAPPPARAWPDRNPSAAARLTIARATVTEIAAHLSMPVENLLQPESLRRLCWSPPDPVDEAAIRTVLYGLGARQWQIDQVAEALAKSLTTAL